MDINNYYHSGGGGGGRERLFALQDVPGQSRSSVEFVVGREWPRREQRPRRYSTTPSTMVYHVREASSFVPAAPLPIQAEVRS